MTKKQALGVWDSMTDSPAVFAAWRFWNAGKAPGEPSAPADFLDELAEALRRQELRLDPPLVG